MMLGLSLETFTLLHVVVSLAGIASGFIVLVGLMGGKPLAGWTAIFLITTVATSVTGYGFPFHELLPSHIVGGISLVVLAVAILARYSFKMVGRWRSAYVITALMALYLNCFVAVVQAFLKVPALHALAPTQTELPFAIAQLAVLSVFVLLTVFALKRFRPEPAAVATKATAGRG